jgi:peptide/nickel transport system ATP-binding protein
MAFDLIVLGRQLTRIGETVMRGQAPPSQPTLAGMVLADVFAHPRSSISEITACVGMPQGHVSGTVARMREQGTVETFPDPGDRRRTLVRVSARHPKNVMRAALVPVDAALMPGSTAISQVSVPTSIQAQILNLLRDLTAQREMSTVIISHDLAVIRFSCHRVIVMCEGAIVEEGNVEDILASPEHPYTRQLIASVPGAPRPGERGRPALSLGRGPH